jgi:hypothetical protein
MSSVAYVADRLQFILEKRADKLAKETGCIKRERKFSGADVVQTLVFGWQQHPHASLESLASTAQVRAVSVSDTAVHKRFTPQCAQFLHAILEEMSSVVVQAAHAVPIKLLRRFRAVILEDSSSISLPDGLAEIWRGCGGNQAHTAAAVKLHVRWELKRGQVQGPKLTDGRSSDHASPFNDEEVEAVCRSGIWGTLACGRWQSGVEPEAIPWRACEPAPRCSHPKATVCGSMTWCFPSVSAK